MLHFPQSSSCSIPNRHRFEPSDWAEEDQPSLSSDSLAHTLQFEHEHGDEHEHDFSRTVQRDPLGTGQMLRLSPIVLVLVLDP
jgi:hypothetical protein